MVETMSKLERWPGPLNIYPQMPDLLTQFLFEFRLGLKKTSSIFFFRIFRLHYLLLTLPNP